MQYIIKRTNAKTGLCVDYLHEWDRVFGTICAPLNRAMTFETLHQARDAISYAKKTCEGFAGRRAYDFIWSAEIAPAARQRNDR